MLNLIVTGVVAAPAIRLAANIATWCFKEGASRQRQLQGDIIRSTRAILADERRAQMQVRWETLGTYWNQVQVMRGASGQIQRDFAQVKALNDRMMRELALTPEQRLAIQECNDQLERGIQRLRAYRGPYLHGFLDKIKSAQRSIPDNDFEYPELPESALPEEFPFAGEMFEFDDAELGNFPSVDLPLGERGRFITPLESPIEKSPTRGLITRYDQEHGVWVLSAARADLHSDLESGKAYRESRPVRLGNLRGEVRQSWWQHETGEWLRVDLPNGLITRLAQKAPWGTEIPVYINQADFFVKRLIGGQEIAREHRYPSWQIGCEAPDAFWEPYRQSCAFSDKLLIRERGMQGDPTNVDYVVRLSTGKEYPIDFDMVHGVARIGNECGERLGIVREGDRDFRVFVFRGVLKSSPVAENADVRELANALKDSFTEQATLSRLSEEDTLELRRYRAVLSAEFETRALRDRRKTEYCSWQLEFAESTVPFRVSFQTHSALPEGCLVRVVGQAEPIGWTEERPSGASGTSVKVLRPQIKLFKEESCPQQGILEAVPVNRELQNKIDAIEAFHSAKGVEGRTQTEQDAFCRLRRELLGEFTPVPLTGTSVQIGGVDKHQRRAVHRLTSELPLVLVQGPPGTGKTQVIAFAIQRILESRPNARIAITSQANPAVDEAILKIQERFPDLKIYRDYSTTAKEKYASLNRGVAVDDYREQLIRQWTSAPRSKEVKWGHVYEWLDKKLINDADALSRLLKNVLARRSQVVACTLSRLATVSRNAPLFDLVIVDEAAKASVPETMIAANCAKRLGLVGDHHQLLPFLDESFFEHSAPTIADQADLKNLWNSSLFARLWQTAPESRKVLLQIMRRSRPAIAQFVSECFYAGALIPGRDNTSETIAFPESLIWVDSEYGKHRAVPGTKSLSNPTEVALAIQACREVGSFAHKKEPSVAIIAFHREQAISLEHAFSAVRLKLKPTIITVDASQGGQWDVVILSIARTHGSSGFVGNPNRFNVAVSRAKDLCVIIGKLSYALNDKGAQSCLGRIADSFYNVQRPGKGISFLNAKKSLCKNFGVKHSR